MWEDDLQHMTTELEDTCINEGVKTNLQEIKLLCSDCIEDPDREIKLADETIAEVNLYVY